MFAKTQRFYDAIYSFKDYAKESATLLALIREQAPNARTLLDVACGTGQHLQYLQNDFGCEGLDLDEGLLAVARARVPNVPLHHGDMTTFDLGKTFDVVTCLFSAIGFAYTLEKMRQAIGRMARHAASGGLVIVEPWLDPGEFKPNLQHALFVDQPELKIARMSDTSREGALSTLKFHYLISTPDGIRYEEEVHRLGLFTREEHENAFRDAGLDVEYVGGGLIGRGLYIGRKA